MMRSVLFFLAALPVALARPAVANPNISDEKLREIEGKYIVTLSDDAEVPHLERHLEWVDEMLAVNVTRRDSEGLGVHKIWNRSFLGYTGKFDEDTIQEIARSDKVLDVEPVQTVELMGTIDKRNVQTQSTWGLGSISNRAKGITDYRYDASSGAGTWAYVIDTGVNAKHVEFQGRAINGYNAVPNTPAGDYHGHGTHCAGTIASRTYGVSKKASIVAVKVVHETSTTTDIVMDGLHWAVNDITSKGRTSKSVISMSLGSLKSGAFNAAVAKAWKTGIVVVAAAGNNNANAGNYSPGSAGTVITVGAIDKTDRRASFSNYGPDVNVFAPGVAITSLGIASNTAIISMSGTSMACPHVAGVVIYLKAKEGLNTPDAMVKRIQSLATGNVVSDPGSGSPNRLLYNGGAAK